MAVRDNGDNGERSLKYAVVKEFVVDWKQPYSLLLAYLEITQSSSVISSLTFSNIHPSNNVNMSTG